MSFFLLYLQAKAISALVVVMSLKPSPISAGLPCLLPLVSNRSKTMWYCMVTVMECLSLPRHRLLVHWYNILSTSDYLEDELRRREMVHVLVSALSICFYSNKAHIGLVLSFNMSSWHAFDVSSLCNNVSCRKSM